MFEPDPPIEFKQPMHKKNSASYSGIALFTSIFEQGPPPERPYFEAPIERKKRLKDQMKKLNDEKNDLVSYTFQSCESLCPFCSFFF